MENIINYLKYGLTIIVGGIGWLVGGYDTIMIALLLFMCFDYISGVMCAITSKKLSSEVGAKGIFKKILIIIFVGLTNILGQATGIEGLRYLVISFYLANEGISLIENAAKLDLPVPNKIKEVLEQLKEDNDKE